jgi:surfactin synthase thioesterase subunit
MAPTESRWLWNLRPAGPEHDAAATVVFLPHAGGSASAFLEWAAMLPDELRTLAAQYAGRGPRLGEPHAVRLDELSRPLTELLDRFDAPLVLVGHSLGALVAFETVRALEARGHPVHGLVVSAARAPDAPTLFRGVDRVPDDGALVALLRDSGGLPAAVTAHDELLELALDAVRADLCMLERYAEGVTLDVRVRCPLTVLCGRSDPLVPVELLEGWARCTDGGSSTELVDGGHFHHVDDLRAVVASVRDAVGSPVTREGAPP